MANKPIPKLVNLMDQLGPERMAKLLRNLLTQPAGVVQGNGPVDRAKEEEVRLDLAAKVPVTRSQYKQ